MGGDSELERAVEVDDTHHKILKHDVVDFMFDDEAAAHRDKGMLMHHASVVPESEEKHSDTTQQHIQMLKEQLEQPGNEYDDRSAGKNAAATGSASRGTGEMPTNLQLGG